MDVTSPDLANITINLHSFSFSVPGEGNDVSVITVHEPISFTYTIVRESCPPLVADIDRFYDQIVPGCFPIHPVHSMDYLLAGVDVEPAVDLFEDAPAVLVDGQPPEYSFDPNLQFDGLGDGFNLPTLWYRDDINFDDSTISSLYNFFRMLEDSELVDAIFEGGIQSLSVVDVNDGEHLNDPRVDPSLDFITPAKALHNIFTVTLKDTTEANILEGSPSLKFSFSAHNPNSNDRLSTSYLSRLKLYYANVHDERLEWRFVEFDNDDNIFNIPQGMYSGVLADDHLEGYDDKVLKLVMMLVPEREINDSNSVDAYLSSIKIDGAGSLVSEYEIDIDGNLRAKGADLMDFNGEVNSGGFVDGQFRFYCDKANPTFSRGD